jgi:hypothetical protein
LFNLFKKINFKEDADGIVKIASYFMDTEILDLYKNKFDYILCDEYSEGQKGESLAIKMYPNKMECYIIRVKYNSLGFSEFLNKKISVISKSKFTLDHEDNLYKKIICKIDEILMNENKEKLKKSINTLNKDLLKIEIEIAGKLKEIKELNDAEQSWNNKDGNNEKISMANVMNNKEEEVKELLKEKKGLEAFIDKTKISLAELTLPPRIKLKNKITS